jgi:2,5-diketo-D-gluconate reductase A
MEHVTLNNGVAMPILGFGVFQIPDAALCEQVVTDALAVSYQSIDTASAYLNEDTVGRAIRASGIPREELFVTTKLWIQDAGYDTTKGCLQQVAEQARARLPRSVPDPSALGDYFGAWRAMQELYQDGLVRAIGVSNFYPDRLVDLIDHNEVTPAVNQIETHF